MRFRLAAKTLPGKPDIVLSKHRAIVLVHGCFWHRHEGCKYTTMPATNTAFWMAKFEANINRDRRVRKLLEDAGWRVFLIWECEIAVAELKRLRDRIVSGT
ncbi:very short patch repair endonuclease [Pseudolysobacter antarcticus]|uniref:very short patch repair endonuclease n=1 Tax=Pseudolysobacter antarcticus TaxID=2511995 RepID=UPI001F5D6C26|nr:DNA mismatch endonuclease Vsr [Pseudolysobacter antarcticus]